MTTFNGIGVRPPQKYVGSTITEVKEPATDKGLKTIKDFVKSFWALIAYPFVTAYRKLSNLVTVKGGFVNNLRMTSKEWDKLPFVELPPANQFVIEESSHFRENLPDSLKKDRQTRERFKDSLQVLANTMAEKSITRIKGKDKAGKTYIITKYNEYEGKSSYIMIFALPGVFGKEMRSFGTYLFNITRTPHPTSTEVIEPLEDEVLDADKIPEDLDLRAPALEPLEDVEFSFIVNDKLSKLPTCLPPDNTCWLKASTDIPENKRLA